MFIGMPNCDSALDSLGAIRLRTVVAVFGIVAIIALACGEPPPTEPGPTQTPTTITLDQTSATLDALGATQQLAATVKDQDDKTMAVTVTWSNSDDDVATVSSSGLVTAEGNGTTSITATHAGLKASATVTVKQKVDSYQDVVGDGQTAVVTQTLADSLGITILDRLGNPVEGMAMHFQNLAEGSVVSPNPVTSDSEGRVRAEWTLGRTAGIQSADAHPEGDGGLYSFYADALPDVVDSLAMIGGDSQLGIPGERLYTNLYVATTDRFGNAITGQQVDFVVTSGGGTIDPTTGITGPNGAVASWWLGNSVGEQTAEARAPGLKGSPVVFTARAVIPSVSRVEPDTIRERFSATVYGTDFIVGETVPFVDGMATLVTEWTDTSITFEVPEFDCRPARPVDVWLWTFGRHSDTVSTMLQPTSMVYQYGYPTASLGIEVGEQLLIGSPSAFCLQFAPADAGEEYLFGVEVALEDPGTTAPFVITSEVGAAAGAPAYSSAAIPMRSTRTSVAARSARLARRSRRNRAEMRLRSFERTALTRVARTGIGSGAQAAGLLPQSPVPGQAIPINVPNLNASDPCTDYTTVSAVVKRVSARSVFLTDAANPAADSVTDAELQGFSDTLNSFIHPVTTEYFGPVSDVDGNGVSYILFSIEVNKLEDGSIGGFTFAGDMRTPAECAGTNGGEIIYAEVPDPANDAGTVARSKQEVLFEFPKTLAHEYTHLIQNGFWWEEGFGAPMPLWEAEGHATLAEEVVGHAILGNSPGQDYGAGVALGAGSAGWYDGLFADLATYYGWDGATSRYSGAPETCSMFGPPPDGTGAACDPAWTPATAWSFMRYLSDRFGPTWAGGEAGLAQSIMRETGSHGSDNISYVMPVGFPDILAGWAAMHFADDRLAGLADSLTMTSWDLADIMGSLGSAAQLAPATFGFAEFSELRVVRAGGTSYTVVSSDVPHSALAVKIRHQNGIEASSGLRSMLWVVRTR